MGDLSLHDNTRKDIKDIVFGEDGHGLEVISHTLYTHKTQMYFQEI